MSACTGCDPLVIVKDSHSSIIWFPQIDVRKKAENFLLNYGYSVRQTEDRNELSILVEKSGNFIPRLTKTLSFVEQQATRVLFFEGTKPRLSDFGSIRTLSELKTIHDAQWLTQLIAEKRLFSVAQPIIEPQNRTVVGHEYLVRGRSTEGFVISPDRLFQTAADLHLLFSLDREARLAAVRSAAHYPKTGMIFVNFAPGAVYDPNVCLKTTMKTIDELGIDPHRVVFEIVESNKIDDLNHLKEIMRFYRKSGFRIALDDFGVGYNNIETYLALEPNFVKLDKTLTHRMINNDRHRDMVESLISQCQVSGAAIIAEGIESHEMYVSIAETGGDFMQGYYFGYPSDPSALNS